MTAEDRLQSDIVAYMRMALAPPAIVWAVPNGGYRSKITAAVMKRTGTLAGVPDLFVMAPGQVICIEVKVPGAKGKRAGVLSESQSEFQKTAELCGFLYVVVRSVLDAEALVTQFKLGRRRAA